MMEEVGDTIADYDELMSAICDMRKTPLMKVIRCLWSGCGSQSTRSTSQHNKQSLGIRMGSFLLKNRLKQSIYQFEILYSYFLSANWSINEETHNCDLRCHRIVGGTRWPKA